MWDQKNMITRHYKTVCRDWLIGYWLAGPRRPSNESDVIVAGCLPIYVSGSVSGYLAISMSDGRFRPRFHSVWSRPLCNCLVKKINQGTDVLTLNCLPPLLALCVLKHLCTILIILTSNHKIKIDVASWQSAFGIHPFDCKYLFYHFRKC